MQLEEVVEEQQELQEDSEVNECCEVPVVLVGVEKVLVAYCAVYFLQRYYVEELVSQRAFPVLVYRTVVQAFSVQLVLERYPLAVRFLVSGFVFAVAGRLALLFARRTFVPVQASALLGCLYHPALYAKYLMKRAVNLPYLK